jgi:hypothetical protein
VDEEEQARAAKKQKASNDVATSSSKSGEAVAGDDFPAVILTEMENCGDDRVQPSN